MRRWWAGGLVALWVIGLLAAAVWSAHNGEPTVRGQSELAEGRQTLDEAVATVTEAAGPAVTVDLEPHQLTTGCRISLTRQGSEVDRTMLLAVPPGQERVLMDRLVDRLPAEWSARYGPKVNRFFADAGNFVAIRGEVAEPGQVRLTAETGCRPGTDPELAQ